VYANTVRTPTWQVQFWIEIITPRRVTYFRLQIKRVILCPQAWRWYLTPAAFMERDLLETTQIASSLAHVVKCMVILQLAALSRLYAYITFCRFFALLFP
jgi:hypothetical protein